MIDAQSSVSAGQNGIGSARVSRAVSGVLAGHIRHHQRDADDSNRDGGAPHLSSPRVVAAQAGQPNQAKNQTDQAKIKPNLTLFKGFIYNVTQK